MGLYGEKKVSDCGDYKEMAWTRNKKTKKEEKDEKDGKNNYAVRKQRGFYAVRKVIIVGVYNGMCLLPKQGYDVLWK